MKPALRKCQTRAIKFGLENAYSILALDPRLGKSRAAIEIHERRKKPNCLVVCPGYLVSNWQAEIEKWASKEKQFIKAVKKGKDISQPFGDYIIISYDLARKAPHFFEWCSTLIIDEAHYLKSIEAKRTEFIHKEVYENSVPCVIQLTGTPLKNRVAEFYSLVALTYYDPREKDPDFLTKFETSIDFADYFSHRETYYIEVGFRTVTINKWVGMQRIPELKKFLKGKYLRIRATEEDFPALHYKDFLVSKTPNINLLKMFNGYFKGEDTGSVKSNFKKEAAIVKAPITAEYAKDLLEQIDTPILIYSDHVDPCEKLAKIFKVPAITGKMPGAKRMELARRFQAGEGKVLCATIGALSVGIDLSRAKDLILNDPSWVPGDLKQVFDRMRKVGDKGSVCVHRILGSPQDAKIWEAIEQKMEVIERAT